MAEQLVAASGTDDPQLDSVSMTPSSSNSNSSYLTPTDPKYKNYVTAIDKALKNFEYSSEWPDLISALTKLNKVITTWTSRYGDLPRLHLVTKRLSQCLHPNLPSGVHLKALETYELIFKSIPSDRIMTDLFSYAAGLFPLWTYASMTLRPVLLKLYENYLTPLILPPSLEGFLISILSGLSEYNDSSDVELNTRIQLLLSRIKINNTSFNKTLWRILLNNPRIRLAGINYILSNEREQINQLFDAGLATDTLVACLADENILVQRSSLELILNWFPLDKITEFHTKLIKGSLKTLLRRDMSLNRRLFSWFGDKKQFEKYCKPYLIESLDLLLKNPTDLTQVEIVRILTSLIDKPEVDILDDILSTVVSYFEVNHNEDSCKVANLFFCNLKPAYVFNELCQRVLISIQLEIQFKETHQIKSHGIPTDSQNPVKINPDQKPVSETTNLLSYIINLNLPCFDSETLNKELPKIFINVLNKMTQKLSNSSIESLTVLLRNLSNCIHLTIEMFESFTNFYNLYNEIDLSEFELIQKQKENDFWACNKMNIEEIKLSCNLTKPSASVYNLFIELLNPVILSEHFENFIPDWLKKLTLSACHDFDSTRVLINLMKLNKEMNFKIFEETHFVYFCTKFLWEFEEFELLAGLICLSKLKIEKLLLAKLSSYRSYEKLKKLLINVGYSDIQLLVFKFLENLNSSDLLLKKQAEEFVNTELFKSADLILVIMNSFPLRTFKSVLDLHPGYQTNDLFKASSTPDLFNKEFDKSKFNKSTGDLTDFSGKVSTCGSDVSTEHPLEVSCESYFIREQKFSEVSIDSSNSGQKLSESNSCFEETLQDESHELDESVDEQSEVTLKNVETMDSLTLPQPCPSPQLKCYPLHPLQTHLKLTPPYDHTRLLYMLKKLNNLLNLNTPLFINCISLNSYSSEISMLEHLLHLFIEYLSSIQIVDLCEDEIKLLHLNVQVEVCLVCKCVVEGLLKQQGLHFQYGKSFVGDILTRVKFQKTLLQILHSTLTDFSLPDLLYTEQLIKNNYLVNDINYAHILQQQITSLLPLVMKLEESLNHLSSCNLRPNNLNPLKYTPLALLKSQPLFHTIIQSGILQDVQFQTSIHPHFNWTSMTLEILQLPGTNQIIILTITQICKNLQTSKSSFNKLEYQLNSLDFLIQITQILLNQSENESERKNSVSISEASSTIYGLLTSFLPGSAPENSNTGGKKITKNTQPQSNQRLELLHRLDMLIKTCLCIKNEKTLPKIINLLNPLASNYNQNFINSLTLLKPTSKLVDLLAELKCVRVSDLFQSKIINENLILFINDFIMGKEFSFPCVYLINLLKECFSKSIGLITVLDIVLKSFGNLEFSKQEVKEVQDICFKILEKIALLSLSVKTDSNELFSNNLNVVRNNEPQLKHLKCLSYQLPNVVDLLWLDDKDRDKLMPQLTHVVYTLLPILKQRKTPGYELILKLIANLSYYSYLRKSWKKEIFELLLLEPGFFQIEVNCIENWKVILDNLFTQDKTSFSELLTRVSVPQTTTLNIFTSKETEYEGRALLLKRLAFVIWSSEIDQHCKFITNIQERLAEALKTSSIQPQIHRSVFLIFRVLIMKFSYANLSALWPIITHEIILVLEKLEKLLMNDLELSLEWLSLSLELFKLIELLLTLEPNQVPLFQMYKWAFLGSNQSVNNNEDGFRPFLLRISELLTCEDLDGNLEEIGPRKPSDFRCILHIRELGPFLRGELQLDCQNFSEIIDIDFIE